MCLNPGLRCLSQRVWLSEEFAATRVYRCVQSPIHICRTVELRAQLFNEGGHLFF